MFSDPAVWKYGTDKDGKGYPRTRIRQEDLQEPVQPQEPQPDSHRADREQNLHRLRPRLRVAVHHRAVRPPGHVSVLRLRVPAEVLLRPHRESGGHERAQRVHRQRRAAEELREGDDEGRRVEAGRVAQGPHRARHREGDDRGVLRRHDEADHDGGGQDVRGRATSGSARSTTPAACATSASADRRPKTRRPTSSSRWESDR